MQIYPSLIDIGKRFRTDDRKVRKFKDEVLIPSIKERGIIQPIIVSESSEPGRYDLIAGWTRLTCAIELKLPTVPVTVKHGLTLGERMAMEMAENIDRNNMSWQDTVIGIVTTHRQLLRDNITKETGWTARMSAQSIGVKESTLSTMLKLYDPLVAGDPEIIAASSVKKAYDVILHRIEAKTLAVLHQRQTGQSAETNTAPVLASTQATRKAAALLKDTGSIDLLGEIAQEIAANPATPQSIADFTDQDQPLMTVPLSKMLFNVSCHDWFASAEPESIDLICTDIPYGIDMANLADMRNIQSTASEHDVDENIEQMEPFLRGSYKVLKPDSYLLFFYDIVHQEKLTAWGLAAGFQVQPFPLLWLKPPGDAKNQLPDKQCTKACEYVMVMRKGSPSMSMARTVNYLVCSSKADRELQAHPFVKPFQFLKWLLEPILTPGMLVLDPYAGGGSIPRAVVNMGGRPIALELKEHHYHDLYNSVSQVYKDATNNRVTFN